MNAKLYLVKKEVAYEEYEKFIAETSIIPFNQMFDPKKSAHYEKVGRDFKASGHGKIDTVIGAVGTGHSLEGIAQGIRAWSPKVSILSAEPCPGLEIPGVRNIEEQKLGTKDPCLNRFNGRILAGKEELFPGNSLLTDKGSIEIGDSFQLVLAAVRKHLKKSPASNIFAVGAENKILSKV